jgi:thiol-disulfide isomerase/thioredoxin
MNRRVPTPVVITAVAAALLAAIWVLGSAMPTEGKNALLGKPAPAIAGEAATGETFRLSDHKGKVVLVNFWATWCGPCRMEVPEMIALQKRYAPRGFTVVGLSLDQGGMPVVRPFAQGAKFNYPVLLAPPGVQQAFGGVPAIPASFLIDRDGNVAHAVEGLVTQDELSPQIEKRL